MNAEKTEVSKNSEAGSDLSKGTPPFYAVPQETTQEQNPKLRSFMLYEIALNQYFQSPLKRHIVCCIFAMAHSEKAMDFKTKKGVRKGLILKYEDFKVQGYSEKEVRKAIKELIDDKYIQKIGMNRNRQLLSLTKKSIKLISDFDAKFTKKEAQNDAKANGQKPNKNTAKNNNSKNSLPEQPLINKEVQADQKNNSAKSEELTLPNEQNSLKVKDQKENNNLTPKNSNVGSSNSDDQKDCYFPVKNILGIEVGLNLAEQFTPKQFQVIDTIIQQRTEIDGNQFSEECSRLLVFKSKINFHQLTKQAYYNVKNNLITQTPQCESIYPPSLDTAPKTRTKLTKHEDLESNNTSLSPAPIQHPITTSTIEDDQHKDHELQSVVEMVQVEESESELDNDLYAFDANLSLDNVDCDDIDTDVVKKIYGCEVEALQESETSTLLPESTADQVQLKSAKDCVNESDHDLIVAAESVEIPQSVDDRLMVSLPLTAMDNQIESLPEIKSNGEIEALGVKGIAPFLALTPDMDANNEISKVGLVKADSLHVRVIANPNTYDDHHLKNTIETAEIAESVGCDMSVKLFTLSTSLELADTKLDHELSPFVATNSETITHEAISDNYHLQNNVKVDEISMSVGSLGSPFPLPIPTDNKQVIHHHSNDDEVNKDTNLTIEELTTSNFDGSFESMVEIEKIVDDTLSEAQWNVLPYYAEHADLTIDDLLGAVLSLMQSNSYKSFPKLIHEAIELARTRVVVEANAKVVSLSDFKLSRSIIQKSSQDIPSYIDFYGIDHAERERGDPLTAKQTHAIHSALDYVQRKAPSMRFDYKELYHWLYFQAVNPTLQFEGCCFRKMMKTAVKLILGSRYRRPKGFALWYGELSA